MREKVRACIHTTTWMPFAKQQASNKKGWLVGSALIRDHEVCIRVIGRLDLLPPDAREVCDRAMQLTAHHKK